MNIRHTGVKWFLGLLCGLGMVNLFAAEFRTDSDGMALVNGKRVFILGLYENPEDDGVLDRIAASGYNLLHAKDRSALDRLHSRNLWGIVELGGLADLSEQREQREESLKNLVTGLRDHPALLAWEMPDEALWNCWYGAELWRAEERRLHRERITALEDRTLAAELKAMREEADRLYADAEYVRGDEMADAIWQKLGEASPRPGYGFGNAPERAARLLEGLKAAYGLIRELDPGHPVCMNHAPRNSIEDLAAYGQAADIVGCDIYPVPVSPHVRHSDLVNRDLSCVGDYTRRMQASAPGKPVWMVLQGFGWADIHKYAPEIAREMRRPNLWETRFMAYDAIVHGARGLVYWGTAFIEKDSALFSDLMALGQEIQRLQPVLSAPDTKEPVKVALAPANGSQERAAVGLGKEVDGNLWIIAVNEDSIPHRVTFSHPMLREEEAFTCRISGREAVVRQGGITFSMRPKESLVAGPRAAQP
ncbi:MAG TPA: hypothetical protein PLO53_00835 [Candidatus Hydrogenedentes bacterium]|nr:hypothetical protein [Candidatus Hydrogenedentota bacterium]